MDESRELIRRARAADRLAQEQLLFSHYGTLLRQIELATPRELKSEWDAEDLMQQVLIQAFQHFPEFAGDHEESLLAWLRTIADNVARDAIRRARRLKRGGDRARISWGEESGLRQIWELLPDREATASRVLSLDEVRQAIHLAIAELPEDYRRVVGQRYFEGLSIEQIAEASAQTPGAVRGILDRARGRLRESLERASRWFT